MRHTFLRDLRATLTVYQLSDEIAELAGAISGRQSMHGLVLPLADLLIAATALQHGLDVLTENVKQFEMIPNLSVKRL